MDEKIAWLLNLRGGDVPYSPLVEGYVYLSLDRIVLFIQPTKTTELIREHLNSDNCQEETICVEVRHYENVFNDLPVATKNVDSVLLPSNYAYSGGVSFAIYETIPAVKRQTSPSPLILLKETKKAIEVEGMKNAHMKDAIHEGKVQWDELKVVHTLDEYRQQQDLNRGPSFSTIAAFGPNGALIHYKPSLETNRIIDNSSFLIIDSGGQYLDETTDVTRTFHFGLATQRQKEIYTRVLMGAIDLAALVFSDSIADSHVDIIARQNLYQVELDYHHETGHGIGSFLNVHEMNINSKEPHRFRANYFFSDDNERKTPIFTIPPRGDGPPILANLAGILGPFTEHPPVLGQASSATHIRLALSLVGFMQYYWPGQLICCRLVTENSHVLEKQISRSHHPPKPGPSSRPHPLKQMDELERDQMKYVPQHKPGTPENSTATSYRLKYFAPALALKVCN
ncbi:hypothetical protein OUZ56_016571 [Daphnia magna]|uniref:Peptidase M24 domain-containing protein n=1 Tax=Daphnia magna TaxID=35525 RepID=A0ABR0AQY6_9CRUS|nr:hypothetical protein OUZ56_016571 [Daphnia magna]